MGDLGLLVTGGSVALSFGFAVGCVWVLHRLINGKYGENEGFFGGDSDEY